MEIRWQKDGPVIGSPTHTLNSFPADLHARQAHWEECLVQDPALFHEVQLDIQRQFNQGADRLAAAILARVTQRPEMKAHVQRVRQNAVVPVQTPERRPLKLRLLSGLVVWLTVLYCPPRSSGAKRMAAQEQPAGLYPELAALGIRHGDSPALQALVARTMALCPSIAVARKELRRQGGEARYQDRSSHRGTTGHGIPGLAAGVACLATGVGPGRRRIGWLPRGRADRWRPRACARKSKAVGPTPERSAAKIPHALARTEGPDHLRLRRAGQTGQTAFAAVRVLAIEFRGLKPTAKFGSRYAAYTKIRGVISALIAKQRLRNSWAAAQKPGFLGKARFPSGRRPLSVERSAYTCSFHVIQLR